MKEVSNKMLVGLLVIAVAVSLVGTFVSLQKVGRIGVLTGAAETTQGTLSFSVLSLAVVNVSTTSVDFGNVQVPGGNPNCVIDSVTGGVGTCDASSNGTAANGGFVFENIGNTLINVSVQSGKSAAGLLGSSSYGADYEWECRTKSGVGTAIVSSFQTVTESGATLCYANMNESSTPGEDEGYLDIQLTVPSDAPSGSKSDTITFSAVQS